MKKQFLETLKKYLHPLDKHEREEILRFYEERFHAGIMYEGLSEEEVIERLESPKQIARNVLQEYGYKFKEETVQEETGIRTGSVIGIILFDFLALAVIYPAILSFFAGMVSGFTAFTFGSLFLSGVTIWTVLFRLGVGFFWLLFVLWLYDIIIGFTAWLIRWHMRVFTIPNASKTAKAMRKIQASYALKKYPLIKRMRTAFSLAAVILIVIGGVFSVFTMSQHPFLMEEMHYEEENYTFNVSDEISEGNAWKIESEMEVGVIILKRTQSETIQVQSLEHENAPVTVIFDETTNTLRFENTFERSFHFFINIFGSFKQPELTIEVPETLIIESIDMNTANSKITIEDFEAMEISLTTSNSTIDAKFLNVSNTLTLKTSNGRIRLFDSTAQDMLVETSNGRIIGERLMAGEYTFKSSNGKVDLDTLSDVSSPGLTLSVITTNGAIDLNNAYVLDVDLRTSNADIDYINDDVTFILDALNTRTTNAQVTTNVAYLP